MDRLDLLAVFVEFTVTPFFSGRCVMLYWAGIEEEKTGKEKRFSDKISSAFGIVN